MFQMYKKKSGARGGIERDRQQNMQHTPDFFFQIKRTKNRRAKKKNRTTTIAKNKKSENKTRLSRQRRPRPYHMYLPVERRPRGQETNRKKRIGKTDTLTTIYYRAQRPFAPCAIYPAPPPQNRFEKNATPSKTHTYVLLDSIARTKNMQKGAASAPFSPCPLCELYAVFT